MNLLYYIFNFIIKTLYKVIPINLKTKIGNLFFLNHYHKEKFHYIMLIHLNNKMD